jgi:hypothetical protein
MYGEVHANRVLYRKTPQPGHRYRQIALLENEQFEVRIFTGDVVQTDPKFIARNSDAEIYFHPNLRSALADVEKEFQDSIAAGWTPYTPNNG